MPATSLMSSCTVSPPPMKVKGSTIETPADRNANFTCLPLPPNSLMFLYDNYFFYLFPYKLYCTVSFCEYVLWYFCTHGSVHAGLYNYLSLTSPQHSLHCMALITWLNRTCSGDWGRRKDSYRLMNEYGWIIWKTIIQGKHNRTHVRFSLVPRMATPTFALLLLCKCKGLPVPTFAVAH